VSKATNLKKKEFGFFMDRPRTPSAKASLSLRLPD